MSGSSQSAGTNYLHLTGLTVTSAIAVCGWVKVNSWAKHSFGTPIEMGFGTGTPTRRTIGVQQDPFGAGTAQLVKPIWFNELTGGGNTSSPTIVTDSSWFFVFMYLSGTSLTIWWGSTTGALSSFTDTTDFNATLLTDMYLGSDRFGSSGVGELIDASFRGVRAWVDNATFNVTKATAERDATDFAPVETSGLVSDIRIPNGTNPGTATSGTNWTLTGTFADDASNPSFSIPWANIAPKRSSEPVPRRLDLIRFLSWIPPPPAAATLQPFFEPTSPPARGNPSPPGRPGFPTWNLTAAAAPAVSSFAEFAEPPRRSRDEPSRLRLATASDAQPPVQLTPYVDWAPPAARAAPAPPRPQPIDGWQLAAVVAAAASTFLALAPMPARAAISSPGPRSVDSGQALAPLQPFPSASPPSLADLIVRGRGGGPLPKTSPVLGLDGSALAPLQPFPSTSPPPLAEPVARGRVGATPPRLLPDGSALVPLQPFPSALYVPSAEALRLPVVSTSRQLAVDFSLAPLQASSVQIFLPPAELPARSKAGGPKRIAPSDNSALSPLSTPPLSFSLAASSPAQAGVGSNAKKPADPDGSALAPLSPFPSQSFVPPALPPARGNLQDPKRITPSDGLALTPVSPAATQAYVPEASIPPRPSASEDRLLFNATPPAPLSVALLPWFDPAPPPIHRETSTKRPVSPDPATLTALPFIVSAWAEFAPPPVSRPTKTQPAFVADPSFFPGIVAQITPWVDFALPPSGSSKAPPRAVPAPDGSTLSPLPPPPAPYELAPTPRRAAATGTQAVRNELPLASLPPSVSAFADFTPVPPRVTKVGASAVRNDIPFASLPAPVVGQFFNLAPPPERGKPPADPLLPAPWFFSPLPAAPPSAWADFALPSVRGFVSSVRAPAAPLWVLRGFAQAVLAPFVPSGEVVFNPTFPSPVLVPFVPSGEVVPPPSFISGTFPPLIASVAQVFEPLVQRRPDQLLSMLDGGTPSLLHVGASGKLFLTPLDQLDARTLALRTLRRYISLLNFRREVAPGEEAGRAFRLKLSQIHTEQPQDSGGEADLPSIAFLPGVGSTDTMGIGGIDILEETVGVEGPGTAIGRYGEYEEQFTIEVVAATVAHRNGIVAGLKQALRMQIEWNETILIVPEMFGVPAEFSVDEVEYVEEPYADQNRRRALLRVSLTVSELFLVRGFPLLDPRVLIELGADVVIRPRVDDDEL